MVNILQMWEPLAISGKLTDHPLSVGNWLGVDPALLSLFTDLGQSLKEAHRPPDSILQAINQANNVLN